MGRPAACVAAKAIFGPRSNDEATMAPPGYSMKTLRDCAGREIGTQSTALAGPRL
jgi:hypothetical protein